MDKLLREKISSEVIAIGDKLLGSSEKDENGTYWTTQHITEFNEIQKNISASLYDGTAGIALYLLELYRYSGDKKYLTTALSAVKWAFRFSRRITFINYGFYTGNVSVIFTALKFFEFTGNNYYLKEALRLIENINAANFAQGVDDLIGGYGGLLLGLIHLHSYTKEEKVLRLLNETTGFLIGRAHIGKKGIYWDRSKDGVFGLCGFSHGAAGLGFTFMELGHYLKNDAFYWLAEKAFDYESQFFDKDEGNWADLRRFKNYKSEMQKQREAYLKSNFRYFTEPRYMNAWCHGAAGIGLSRLRAYEILGKKKYLLQTKTAIDTTVSSDLGEEGYRNLMIYCHGNCGNADLYIESYLRFGNKKYLAFAEQAAKQALLHKQHYGYYRQDKRLETRDLSNEDKSLFTGSAGIGHFYLRILEPQKFHSVLMPVVNDTIKHKSMISKYNFLKISTDNLKLTMYKKIFPVTFLMLQHNSKDKAGKELTSLKNDADLTKSFRKFFREEQKRPVKRKARELTDVYKYENKVIVFDNSIKSYALLDMKRIIENENNEQLLSLGENDFLNVRLCLNDTVLLLTAHWDWSNENAEKCLQNLGKPKATHYVVLKHEPEKTESIFVSQFIYTILVLFEKGLKVNEMLEKLVFLSGINQENELNKLKAMVLLQLKELIGSRYLRKI